MNARRRSLDHNDQRCPLRLAEEAMCESNDPEFMITYHMDGDWVMLFARDGSAIANAILRNDNQDAN